MRKIKVFLKEGMVLANNVVVAENFLDRLRGLMFIKRMSNFDGMLIMNCPSIHTFFMYFSIDVIFLNKDNQILKIYRKIKPWRMTKYIIKAQKALEFNGGFVPPSIQEGQYLNFVCIK